jgi:hypothetical protein
LPCLYREILHSEQRVGAQRGSELCAMQIEPAYLEPAAPTAGAPRASERLGDVPAIRLPAGPYCYAVDLDHIDPVFRAEQPAKVVLNPHMVDDGYRAPPMRQADHP